MSAPIVRVYRKHPILFWIWAAGSIAACLVMDDIVDAIIGAVLGLFFLWFITNPREMLEAFSKGGSSSAGSYESNSQNTVTDNYPRHQEPERRIAYAIQHGTQAEAYDANNKFLFARPGQLEGWTSTTMTVYNAGGHQMLTYDVNDKFISSRGVYK